MQSSNYTCLLTCVFLSVISLTSCSPDQKDAMITDSMGQKIDVKVSVEGIPSVITGNSLQTVKYDWSLVSSESLSDQLSVKVHYVNDDNRIIFQDDHSLPSLGPNISYIRDVLIPLIPRPQNIHMLIGLYSKNSDLKYVIPDETGVYKNKIKVISFKVTPPLYVDDLPEARVAFGEGWYQKEFSANQTESWRWMGKQAHCRLKGADRDLTLYIHGWIPEDRFPNKLTLELDLKDETIGTYSDLSGEFIIKLDIANERIANNETEELTITANDSFTPSESEDSDDNRVMSAMIKSFYFN
ncbi:hypothetical protein JW823_06805 [bacterium]|nr:hypothetical protein [candidate division CSSED10-310 bacterium]